MRCLPAGDTALLVELADLDQVLALFQHLQRHPLPGIAEIVPAARTLMLHYSPDAPPTGQTVASLRQAWQQTLSGPAGQPAAAAAACIDIPVHYHGEDLESVAAMLDISSAELIERHTGSDYLAAFAGFAPGFVYLSGGHASLRIPRRRTPRTRVPAGAVALAGEFSSVYPSDSPGGWQLIGATPLRLWDLARHPAALIQPGCRVRFRDLARRTATITLPPAAATPATADTTLCHRAQSRRNPAALNDPSCSIVLAATGLQTLVQDQGRPGKAGMGVSVSGALDLGAMRDGNRLVGNPIQAAVLENLLGQLRLVSRGPAVVAVTGANAPLTLITAGGRRLPMPTYQPLALDDGDTLAIGTPAAGLRCYVAVRGGLKLAPVLDSCATDTLAKLGPPPLQPGDELAIGAAGSAAGLHAVLPSLLPPCPLPSPGDTVTLDVVPGPRTDWFRPEALALLFGQPWTVTPQSDRVGIRLAGQRALDRRITDELPSEGTVTGALQVPADGQPILFLADHPLTGGYPVIGVVARHHLDLAAQIPAGARLRFRPLTASHDIAPALLPPPQPAGKA